ncbi:MAG TPA: aspartate carbamoyltransferase [Terriglobales bacterium]|jgi:aspartate carbamoyltransferase catalytic subunit|nr:aspartate carbamoyltransferase [Terriglobales bacterium]
MRSGIALNHVVDRSTEPETNGTRLKHVVESQQFTLPLLMELFGRSRGMEKVVARGGTLDYQNKILASLFYEPSTRTRFSFEAAMHRLGGRVLSTEHARAFSSEIEGERVEDSIRIIGSYSDVIVIRHHEEGGAQRAAQVSPVPVINAGDGEGGQHPTQALLDLFTIYRERPLDGLSVAFIGELDKGRTARSLAYLLAKFERVKIFFVSPPELQMKDDILQYLDRHGVRYELESEIGRVVGEVDVIYQTRIRPERVADAPILKRYAIDSTVLQKMKSNAMILHPLPRTVELDKTVDDDPRALYFRQATNGLYVRMALLTMLLE